jgi:hypothetical protein
MLSCFELLNRRPALYCCPKIYNQVELLMECESSIPSSKPVLRNRIAANQSASASTRLSIKQSNHAGKQPTPRVADPELARIVREAVWFCRENGRPNYSPTPERRRFMCMSTSLGVFLQRDCWMKGGQLARLRGEKHCDRDYPSNLTSPTTPNMHRTSTACPTRRLIACTIGRCERWRRIRSHIADLRDSRSHRA